MDIQQSQIPTCTCYVQELEPEVQFSLHYGAHGLACPQWRESRDIVDRQNDLEARQHWMGTLYSKSANEFIRQVPKRRDCGCGARIGPSSIMCGECSRKITKAINA